MRFILLIFAVLLFSACGDSASTEAQTTTDTVATDTVPTLRAPTTSELTVYMRNMETHFQGLSKTIGLEGTVDSTNAADFEGMYVMKASPHIEMDSAFMAYGNDFLSKYDELINNTIVDSTHVYFNAAVDACIKCHQNFCPGPVVRIKKLRMSAAAE